MHAIPCLSSPPASRSKSSEWLQALDSYKKAQQNGGDEGSRPVAGEGVARPSPGQEEEEEDDDDPERRWYAAHHWREPFGPPCAANAELFGSGASGIERQLAIQVRSINRAYSGPRNI